MEYKDLEAEFKDGIHGMLIGQCLHGGCFIFALALNRDLGWPMVGLMRFEEIIHAALINPEEKSEKSFWDCRGLISENELGQPFSLKPPYTLKSLTAEKMQAIQPVNDYQIESASRKAQIVWPNLPWKPHSFVVRLKAYMLALEKLSQKHKMWIYGNFPQLPAIAEGEGDEKGYALSATASTGYMFNRVLK